MITLFRSRPTLHIKASSTLRILQRVIFLMLLGVTMEACSSSTTWKEEVLLHDGSKIIVTRTQVREGRHEIGQGPPIKEQEIVFTVPGSSAPITWEDGFSADLGHANFNVLALHLSGATPYIVVSPAGCLAYNKWGRPNPPYVIFRYDGNVWPRIALSELPEEFTKINMVIDTINSEEALVGHAVVTADLVMEINGSLQQEELKSIVRLEIKSAGQGCPKMVYDGNGGWLGIDWFTSQSSYEACVKFCASKNINPINCPCDAIFKEK